MSKSEFELAAEQNVDCHLGDVVTEEHEPADVADEVYTLAFDGAFDAGADAGVARAIAETIKTRYPV